MEALVLYRLFGVLMGCINRAVRIRLHIFSAVTQTDKVLDVALRPFDRAVIKGPHSLSPVSRALLITSSITALCTAFFTHHTFFADAFSRPASNCGFMSATMVNGGCSTAATAGSISFSEINETS